MSRTNRPLMHLLRQRSHLLFVLSCCDEQNVSEFLRWYQGEYRDAIFNTPRVISAQHYEQHEIDITKGGMARLPFKYLGIYELSLDGAEEASDVINRVATLHREQHVAKQPATWLYYPMSERVGCDPTVRPSMLTIAFANSVPGHGDEFREWYATRHIRHALKVPALVSGQCYARTQFQQPGARKCSFEVIAVYEQDGTPESIIASFAMLPPEALRFPTLDVATSGRFAEWVYRPIVATALLPP
jgi:hypothetical protein